MKRPMRRGSKSSSGSGLRMMLPSSPNIATRIVSANASSLATVVPLVADEISNDLSVASLTLDTPLVPLRRRARLQARPFRFLDLPSELRVKVYEHFFSDTDKVLDLGPDNYKRIHKTLGLMRVCKQMHAEATHFFYSTRSIRLFPTYPGRYFKSKKPLLARLKPNQRRCITSLELRIGPGWNAPPRGWVVNEVLGLQDCVNLRKLTVFVECDPSDGVFKGFRRSEGFYEGFSAKLLGNVLAVLPDGIILEFDAWSSVKKTGEMMRGLLTVASRSGQTLQWGNERGWTNDSEEENIPKTDQSPGLTSSDAMQDLAPHDVLVLA